VTLNVTFSGQVYFFWPAIHSVIIFGSELRLNFSGQSLFVVRLYLEYFL